MMMLNGALLFRKYVGVVSIGLIVFVASQVKGADSPADRDSDEASSSISKSTETSSPKETSPYSKSSKASFPEFVDYDEALAESKKLNRPILVVFTGSTWCVPCQIMEKEVFHTYEFKEYVRKNLVLLIQDFPVYIPETLEEPQLKKRVQLRDRFKIKGVPIYVLLDSQGKELGRFGFAKEGFSEFMGNLERLKNLK